MPLPSLELDNAFLNFNFCDVLDPTLKPGQGPTQAHLIEMVYAARQGDRSSILELASTIYWTLREEAFMCFQQLHGPRPIRYRDWFHCKLRHFLEMLVYESLSVDGYAADGSFRRPQTERPWEEGFLVLGSAGPPVQPEDVEAAFVPEDNEVGFWSEIVSELCEALGDRLSVLEAMMSRMRQERAAAGSVNAGAEAPTQPVRRWEWKANRERNRIIRNLQAQGKDGYEICQELDKRTIATLDCMQKRNVHSWVVGWGHEQFSRNIQQLLSKLRRGQKAVKP